MALTKPEVASKALVMVGANQISSFDGSEIEKVVSRQIYETIVEDCIGAYYWDFASGSQQLVMVTGTTLVNFDNAFQLPTNPAPMTIESVRVNGVEKKYDIFEDKLFIDANEENEVILDYTFRADESTWHPAFTMWAVLSLAEAYALSITRKEEIAEAFGKKAETQFAKAKARVGKQTSNKAIRLTRLTSQTR
tara:strand:+ start:2860 stop:3438 length:579 start_codon:yes stop_codon:yes gene_type:complete